MYHQQAKGNSDAGNTNGEYNIPDSEIQFGDACQSSSGGSQ